jgi:hypothetical protein
MKQWHKPQIFSIWSCFRLLRLSSKLLLLLLLLLLLTAVELLLGGSSPNNSANNYIRKHRHILKFKHTPVVDDSVVITHWSLPLDIAISTFTFGARSGAVGWGIALQAVMSQVRFPMVSLKFFIDIMWWTKGEGRGLCSLLKYYFVFCYVGNDETHEAEGRSKKLLEDKHSGTWKPNLKGNEQHWSDWER